MGAGAIGHAAALAALGLGLASIAAAPAALRASTRLQAAAAGAWALALGSLAWAFVGADYTLAYVAANSRRDAPAPLRAAGVWGGMEGSLLLWTALLALVGAAAAPRLARDLPRRAGAAALGLLGGFAAANGAVLLAWADPFTRLAAPPLDGGGLSPILEHPAMVYHPPVLYLGLVGLAPLFALCAAASLAGGLDGAWERLARRLAAGPLALVTVGLAAGAGWAYAELGWGGYWAWDPVENAALAPWLAAAAFLHASRTGAGRRTLTALGTAPFALVAAGAAVTRSGASSSVHAFADNPQAGWALTVCAGSIALLGLAAVLAVRPKPAPSPPPVGAQRARWAGAALFALAALVVAAGTIGPWAASLGGGRSRTVDGVFFAAFLGPAAVVGLALGAAPAWAHAGRPG
ncbi:MAG: cytochrome c biogenesis protein CcsA, partial [Acidimicrobiales bacterium]